jgi:hypothetical protein
LGIDLASTPTFTSSTTSKERKTGPTTYLVSFFFVVLNTNLFLLYIKVVNYEIHDREGGNEETTTTTTKATATTMTERQQREMNGL